MLTCASMAGRRRHLHGRRCIITSRAAIVEEDMSAIDARGHAPLAIKIRGVEEVANHPHAHCTKAVGAARVSVDESSTFARLRNAPNLTTLNISCSVASSPESQRFAIHLSTRRAAGRDITPSPPSLRPLSLPTPAGLYTTTFPRCMLVRTMATPSCVRIAVFTRLRETPSISTVCTGPVLWPRLQPEP